MSLIVLIRPIVDGGVPVVPAPAPATPRSGQPELVVEIDFVNDPNPDSETMPLPVWTDITEYVLEGGVSIDRGRQRSLDRVEAGTATFLLDNRDRRFDPSDVDSPYYPFVLPMRRVRATATYPSGVDSFMVGHSYVGDSDSIGAGDWELSLFSGYIQSWGQDFPSQGFDATATVSAVDMFSMFSADTVTLATDETFSASEQLNRILNTRTYTGRVAFSDGTAQGSPFRNFDTGAGLGVGSPWTSGTGMLAALLSVADSDGGLFFIAADGVITYYPPARGTSQPETAPTFGVGGEPVRDIGVSYDETLIYNVITVKDAAGATIGWATDTASIRRYGLRELTLSTNLKNSTDGQIRADLLLDRYHSPVVELRELDLSYVTEDWGAVLSRDLWDMVTVTYPLPNGDEVEQLSLIEGIRISTPRQDNWSVIWRLSAVDVFPNLLTDNQSSLETGDTTGWGAETNCSITASSSSPLLGSYSLRLAATAAGDVAAITDEVAVAAGSAYEATANIVSYLNSHEGTTPAHLEIDWLDVAHALISTTVGSAVSIQLSWRQAMAAATSPADTAYAVLRIHVDDAVVASTGYIYADDMRLRRTA